MQARQEAYARRKNLEISLEIQQEQFSKFSAPFTETIFFFKFFVRITTEMVIKITTEIMTYRSTHFNDCFY